MFVLVLAKALRMSGLASKILTRSMVVWVLRKLATWEVVGDGSIVDADGVSGGGVAQREQEEKEKWDKLGL